MAEYIVGVKIVAKSETAAIERARQQFEQLAQKELAATEAAKRHAATTTQASNTVAAGWKKMANAVLGYVGAFLGVQKVIQLYRESIAEFSQGEQVIANLRSVIATFNKGTDISTDTIHTWSATVQEATQVADDMIETIVAQFIPVTENTAAAMYLTELAAKAQKAGWTDAKSAADTLGAAMLGRVRRGSDQLSQTLYKGKVSGEEFVVTLGKIEAAVDAAGNRALTAAEEIKRIELMENDAAEAMGKVSAKLALAFEGPREAWSIFQAMVVGGIIKIGAYIGYAITSVRGWGSVLWEVAKGPMGDVGKAWEQFKSDLVLSEQDIARANASAQELIDGVVDAYTKQGPAAKSLKEKLMNEGKQAAVAAAQALQDAKRRKEVAAAEKAANEEIVKGLQARIKAEQDTATAAGETVEAQEKAYANLLTLLDQYKAARIKVIEDERKASLEEVIGNVALEKAINEKAAQEKKNLTDELVQLQIAGERAVTDAMRREREIRRAMAQAEIALAQEELQARLARLEIDAAAPDVGPRRLAQIAGETAALKAQIVELRLRNNEIARQAALDNAAQEGPYDPTAINNEYGRRAQLIRDQAEADVAATGNAHLQKIKQLLDAGKTEREIRLQQYDERIADLQATAERERQINGETSAAYLALLDEQERLTREKEMAKAQMSLETAAMVVQGLGQAFPEVKAFAIAEAVIATALNILKVFPNPAMMAFAAALGALQIAKIASAQPGSASSAGVSGPSKSEKAGFDSPRNDAVAWQAGYRGSARWADDMVAKYNSGIDRGWAERMAQLGSVDRRTVVNDNSRGSTVIQHLTYLWGPQTRGEAARASRIVDAGRRRSSRSRVGAGAATLGGA